MKSNLQKMLKLFEAEQQVEEQPEKTTQQPNSFASKEKYQDTYDLADLKTISKRMNKNIALIINDINQSTFNKTQISLSNLFDVFVDKVNMYLDSQQAFKQLGQDKQNEAGGQVLDSEDFDMIDPKNADVVVKNQNYFCMRFDITQSSGVGEEIQSFNTGLILIIFGFNIKGKSYISGCVDNFMNIR